VYCIRECTPPYLSTGISNLLQPAQAEVMLGQLSTYIASWVSTEIHVLRVQTVRSALLDYEQSASYHALTIMPP
jgi:hypothetical protein